MFELPDMQDVAKVTVDKTSVKGHIRILLSHIGKNNQHQWLKLNLFLEIDILIAI